MKTLGRKLFGRVVSILGKRAFFSFGIVTFLVAALLAGVNVASRYALKVYMEDQLQRVPWDLAVYQTAEFALAAEIPDQIRSVEGVRQVESLAFLRTQPPPNLLLEIDGKPLAAPFISVMAATDPDLLLPQLKFALGNSSSDGLGKEGGEPLAVVALTGPERSMGRAFLALQGAQNFAMKVPVQGADPFTLFSSTLHGVIRMDRDELDRWFMDQTGSITFVPYVGMTLLMPYRFDVLSRFDSAALGLLPTELEDVAHVQTANYLPEVIHVARVDRKGLISGWDIAGSLTRLAHLHHQLQAKTKAFGPLASVDPITLVLLERMNRIARLIGLITLLVAFPLIWMGWVLAANLSGLLMLNERRKLGLMRLRGVPGGLMGRAFLFAIGLGGLLGGILGLVAGSVLPLLYYEGGRLPGGVLTEGRQLLLFLGFLIIVVVLALLVSRRLIRYATEISPLEASGRVAVSEASRASVRFGILQLLALLIGIYKLSGWIFGFSVADVLRFVPVRMVDRLLDFIGLPLFLYGATTLLVARKAWMRKLVGLLISPTGGRLSKLALNHVSVKPHRTASFMLIVALMAGVSLYPTVTTRSFRDKALRGARVQMGTDIQFTLNTPDLVSTEALQGGLGHQFAALRPKLQETVNALSRLEGVSSVTYMLEALLPGFYFPNRGRGVPLYLIENSSSYLQNVYAEEELGITQGFGQIVAGMQKGGVAVSEPVSEFWRLSPGDSALLGPDVGRKPVFAPVSGVLGFPPGTPPISVSNRQTYVQARLDYLNHLFSNNAFLVGIADDPYLANLQGLIPRVIVLVNVAEGTPLGSVQKAVLEALPIQPLEMHDLPQEIQKVGSDMFSFLALENMRIYLVGGLLLAFVAILAIGLANYLEDRRTLALIRIRGAAPLDIWRFLAAILVAPALLGLMLGGTAALLAGYGLTNLVWSLREFKTVVQLLTTHLIISQLTVGVALLLLVMLLGVVLLFSAWVFRRSAHETVLGE